MGLFEIATAAQLAGSVVLALFFLLLTRHDSRPYLRDWTSAWVAQVLALLVLLAAWLGGWYAGRSLYLFLETAHGMLLCAAAFSYARGRQPDRLRLLVLGPVALWAAVAPVLFPGGWSLHAAQFSVLALTHVAAAALLWRLREPTGFGLRMVTNVLALLALLYVLHALAFVVGGDADDATLRPLEVAPFTVLLLQTLLGLGMVMTVMEATQWALAATNTQLEEAQRRLKVLAETDPLTGCFNRRVFRDLVDTLRGTSDTAQGVVMLLDMDGLKAINDRDGHAAGDEAIVSLAEAIRGRTRPTDVVVRWGGDEFVVVVPGAGEHEGRTRLAQIVEAITEAGLGASAGLAAYQPGTDIMVAVERADQAMYQAKSERRSTEAS